MNALVDKTPFHFNIGPATEVADFPPMYAADRVTLIPYKREETVSINAKFKQAKTCNNIWKNIFCAVYNTINLHVHEAVKVARATSSHSWLE